MVIAVQNDLKENPDSPFNQTYIEIIAPSSIFIYVITLYILYSIRYVELVIGALRTTILITLSLLLDFVLRTILLNEFNIQIRCTGPFSLLSALLFSYWILFPTYRSNILPVSDKLIMLVILLVAGSIDAILVLIPVLCGFISFFVLSPFIIPNEKTS